MSAPLLIDLSHTSHTHAKTGVQRVARAFITHAATPSEGITYDPYEKKWRILETWEYNNLTHTNLSKKRGAKWPISAQIKGRAKRFFNSSTLDLKGRALFVPEIFSPLVNSQFSELFACINGPRVAIFHDALALSHPDYTPPKTLIRFPSYLQELARFDAIITISAFSKNQLLDYWNWAGLKNTPEVKAIPLGIDTPPVRSQIKTSPRPSILCVGSIEGRKNHYALLQACERLWEDGTDFELVLIGLPQNQTAHQALSLIETLKAKQRPLIYKGAADDTVKEEAYQTCLFTIYPSLCEGYGIPIAESLARAKPCICLGSGAMGEIAQGGGCLTLESGDVTSIQNGIKELLSNPRLLEDLTQKAKARPIKSWETYVQEVTQYIESVHRRS